MAFFDKFTLTTLIVFIVIVAVIIGLTLLAIFLIRKAQKKARSLLNSVENNPEVAAGVARLASKAMMFL